MRRTLQTAIHMFKHHPNKDQIKFLVVPIIHESVGTFDDINMDPEELIKTYSDLDRCHGVQFDFSTLCSTGPPSLWYMKTFTNNKTVMEFYERLDKLGG